MPFAFDEHRAVAYTDAEAVAVVPQRNGWRSPGRTMARIDGLSDEPRPSGCTKLTGYKNSCRVRAGDYRIVYTIDDTIRVVSVTRVAHRREVYR